MRTNSNTQNGPVSWPGTIAGMLPFVSFASIDILRNALFPVYPDATLGRQISSALLLLGSFGVPFVGFAAGWARGFPRWSYGYVGFSLLITLYFSQVSTPGLVILGYEFGRNVWGLLACLPLVILLLIVLALTRSLDPTRFFTNIKDDWTYLTFAMFGFMPLIASIGFDEVANSYEYPFQFLLGVVMAATAGAYLRSRHHPQRVFSLYLGLAICVGITALAVIFYWLPLNGVDVPRLLFQGLVLYGFMCLPACWAYITRD